MTTGWINQTFCIVCEFLNYCWGYTGPGRHPLVLVVQFYVECIQNHVCGPVVVQDMSIFLISKYSVNFKMHLYKRRRKHRRAVVAVAVAAVEVAVVAAVAVVTAAASPTSRPPARPPSPPPPPHACVCLHVCRGAS